MIRERNDWHEEDMRELDKFTEKESDYLADLEDMFYEQWREKDEP